MSEIITVQAKSLSTLAAEIRTIHDQTKRVVIYGLIEIGRRLTEAKSLCPHGEWGEWLEREVSYSQSTATNYMNIYKEYGDQQFSLFGSPNSQAFENLNYSQLVLLATIPQETREQFVSENDVANMSSRELEKALKDLKAANQARETAEAKLSAANDRIVSLEGTLHEKDDESAGMEKMHQTELSKLRQDAQNAESAAAEVKRDLLRLQNQLTEARTNERKAKEDLQKAQKNPDVPESVMEEIRLRAEAEALEKITKQLQQQIKKAEARAAEAEKARDDAERDACALQEKLDAAEKAASVMDPSVAAIQVLINGIATDWNMIMGHWTKAVSANPENGPKLKKGLQTLIDKLQNSLNGATI